MENPRNFPGIFPRNPRKFPGIFHGKILWKCRQEFRGISRNPFRRIWFRNFSGIHFGIFSGIGYKKFPGIGLENFFRFFGELILLKFLNQILRNVLRENPRKFCRHFTGFSPEIVTRKSGEKISWNLLQELCLVDDAKQISNHLLKISLKCAM